jgi:phosphatidylglycerol lysyltransferase
MLAGGLYRRLDAAWSLTIAALCCGTVVSLVKGLDWEEAAVLSLVLSITWISRSAFYRRSSLFNEEPSPFAILAAALACATSMWVGFLAFKQVKYSNELWWQVAYSADAPRFLRASLLIFLMAGATGLYLLLRSPRRRANSSYDIPPDIVQIVNRAANPDANLALTGDKRFLVADEGDAFLMYDLQGRSWIAMGDPIGNVLRFDDLLWRFRELADCNGGHTVFYQVSAENLPRYLDLGLSLLKLGEEALIDLEAFSLEGRTRANLRQSSHRGERQGLCFSVASALQIPGLLPELAEISAEWLAGKGAAEKGFSVGRFDPSYLSDFDHALVWHNGRIVAFANIWQSSDRLSVDLMRHRIDAPKGHMDYLFVQLMLWSKAKGFKWFSLGMAPLSGLETHPLASTWHKAGNLIFQHGERIYGFEGLRAFKEKFRPEWRSRYLACDGGLSLPLIVLDVTLLVSRRRRASPTLGSAQRDGDPPVM